MKKKGLLLILLVSAMILAACGTPAVTPDTSEADAAIAELEAQVEDLESDLASAEEAADEFEELAVPERSRGTDPEIPDASVSTALPAVAPLNDRAVEAEVSSSLSEGEAEVETQRPESLDETGPQHIGIEFFEQSQEDRNE